MDRSFIKKTAACAAALMMVFVSVPHPDTDMDTMTFGAVVEAADNIIIDETNFPDAFFRNYVCKCLNRNDGDSASAAEFAAITAVTCNNMNITSLKGIEYFTGITSLSCKNNKLKELMSAEIQSSPSCSATEIKFFRWI